MASARKTPPAFRNELPTLVPDFDPVELAQESELRLRNAEAAQPTAAPDEQGCLSAIGRLVVLRHIRDLVERGVLVAASLRAR